MHIAKLLVHVYIVVWVYLFNNLKIVFHYCYFVYIVAFVCAWINEQVFKGEVQ